MSYYPGMVLASVSGTPTVFTPVFTSLQTIRYEAITVPAEHLSSTIYEVTGTRSITTIQKQGQEQGYHVLNIGPLTAPNSSPPTTSLSRGGTSSPSGSTSTPFGTLPIKPTVTSAGTPTRALSGAPVEKSANSHTSKPPLATPNNKGIGVVAGTLGALFAITLVALLFLIFKLRKEKKKAANGSVHSPPTMAFIETGSAKGQSTISELSARNTDLMNQLEERNTQLSALQATLMRSNSVPPSLDDRSIASRFKQLEQELKDWVIIHFKSTEQRLDLSPELREILISQVPLFDRLLQQPRSRTMVLRAVAGYVFYKAFESGEFVGVGEGLGALERSMGRNISETEFNKWRSQTFLILSKASTTESKAQVVATISQRIDNLLSPFSTTANQPERLHFLSRIVESAATLSLDLGCQLAKFKVLSEPAETPFHCAHMEDVYQEHETQVDPHTGKLVNALDGRVIQAVVFPSVIKWGNERGENYEEMKVLLKATVLT